MPVTVPSSGQPAPGPARGPLVLAALGGFVLAAVIALVLWATGVFDSGSSDGGSSDASISLPAKVGSYVRFQDVTLNKQPRAKAVVANNEQSDARTAAALSRAYGGAGAAVQTYADQKLATTFTVWAVRARTPDPVVGYEDAKFLGLAVATDTVQHIGPVTCQLHNNATPAGKLPAKDAATVVLCQRTSESLTVVVRNVSGVGTPALNNSPNGVAAVVDQVWDAVD